MPAGAATQVKDRLPPDVSDRRPNHWGLQRRKRVGVGLVNRGPAVVAVAYRCDWVCTLIGKIFVHAVLNHNPYDDCKELGRHDTNQTIPAFLRPNRGI